MDRVIQGALHKIRGAVTLLCFFSSPFFMVVIFTELISLRFGNLAPTKGKDLGRSIHGRKPEVTQEIMSCFTIAGCASPLTRLSVMIINCDLW